MDGTTESVVEPLRIRLGIQDYQILGSATLVFEPGVTVIQGPSNSGKTALLRALRDLLDNPSTGKMKIRHGAKRAEVALDVSGYEPIQWIREKGSASYKVGEETHSKMGRGKLADIYSALPFLRDERGNLLNLHMEFDVLFPFGHSSSELFRVFEGVFGIEDAAAITNRMKEDTRENTEAIEKNENEIQRNQVKVGAIDQVLSEVDGDQLQKMGVDLTEAITKAGCIAHDLNITIDANRKLEILSNIPTAEHGWLLGASPTATDGKDNGKGSAHSGDATATVNATTPEAGVFGPRFASGNIDDAGADAAGRASLAGLEALWTFRRDAAQAERLDARLRGLRPAQRKTFDFAAISSAVILRADCHRAEVLMKQISGAKPVRREFSFAAFEQVRAFRLDLQKIAALANTITTLNKEVQGARAELRDVEQTLASVEFCPLCGKALDHGDDHAHATGTVE